MKEIKGNENSRSQHKGNTIPPILIENPESHGQGHARSCRYHAGKQTIDSRHFMKLKIQESKNHQQTEWHKQHACKSHQCTNKPMKLSANINSHIDLIRTRKQSRYSQTRKELLITHPAAVIHDDALTPSGQPSAKS